MFDNREVCGTCKYHIHDDEDDWICVNNASENWQAWTEYNDKCDEWESRR